MWYLFDVVIFMRVALAEGGGLRNFPYYDKDIFHPPRPGCVWNEERSKYYCGAGRAVPNRAPPPIPQIMEQPVEEIADISNETPVDISLLIPDLEEEPSPGPNKPGKDGKGEPPPGEPEGEKPGKNGKTKPSPGNTEEKKPGKKGKTTSWPDNPKGEKTGKNGKTEPSHEEGNTPGTKGEIKFSPCDLEPDTEQDSDEANGPKKFSLGVRKQVTWDEAKQNCEYENKKLANILNKSEQKRMEETINSEAEFWDKSFWIGGRYSHKIGRFQWTINKPLSFTNWAKGQPNNEGYVEACVEVSGAAKFRWKDKNCLTDFYYICEYRIEI